MIGPLCQWLAGNAPSPIRRVKFATNVHCVSGVETVFPDPRGRGKARLSRPLWHLVVRTLGTVVAREIPVWDVLKVVRSIRAGFTYLVLFAVFFSSPKFS